MGTVRLHKEQSGGGWTSSFKAAPPDGVCKLDNTAWCKKNSCMFEFPALLPPTNLGLLMHSPSAPMEHVLLNLARLFFARSYTRC